MCDTAASMACHAGAQTMCIDWARYKGRICYQWLKFKKKFMP